MNQSSTKAFWLLVGISAAFHAMLLLVWFNEENNETPFVSKEYKISLKLSSDSYSAASSNAIEKNNIKNITENHTQNISDTNTPIKKQTKTSSTSTNTTSSSKNILEVKPIQTHHKELNKLLYHAINKNKNYPISALRLSRQGTVRVSFKLLNNGNINALEIYQSSGFNSLDKAALNAVKQIQPFQPATQYIASVKEFQLDIKFQL